MTNGTDLAELLAAARVDGRPPSVAELRRRGRAARRRRRVTAAAAAGLVALAAIVGAVALAARPPSFDVATVDSTGVLSTTLQPASTGPPPTVAAAHDDGPAILAPPDGWEIASLQSGGYTAPDPTATAVAGPDGVLGPMAWVRFNAGVATIDYPDGPTTHRDSTSPAGRTVRVGWSVAPEDLSAIAVVDGGSVAITSYDMGEPDLLRLIDAVTVTDGRVSVDPAGLPLGFTLHPTTPDRPYLAVSYSLLRGSSGITVQVSRWVGVGSDALTGFRNQSGLVATTIGGRPALIAPADPTSDSYASALLIDAASWDDPGWAYSFTIPPVTDTGPGATPAEIEGLLASLTVVTADELRAELPELQDRQATIDRWLADVPVPATADLSALRHGPPLGPEEAEWFYQVLKCTVVLDWAITGNDERLDQVEASAAWTVGVDLNRHWDAIFGGLNDPKLGAAPRVEDLVPRPGVLASARAATTGDERWATTLVDDCRWAIPLTGQRRR